MISFFTFLGKVTLFGLKAVRDAVRPPIEWQNIINKINDFGVG